jgi:hypothetical protein
MALEKKENSNLRTGEEKRKRIEHSEIDER